MQVDLDSAISYHYDAFPPARLDYSRLIDAVLRATDAIARYDQMLKTLHNNEIFLAPLRNQEAVISSRMEGTISTMDEILKFQADHDESKGVGESTRSEVVETYLYQRALRTAQDSLAEGRPLSLSLVKSLHQQLLSFGRGASKSPGKLKNEQNYLADKFKKKILFIPISPEKLQDGLDVLFEYIHNSEHPALIKAALAHVEFEALHPFMDGNGRIGRMLITLMLWACGSISAPHFYISAYFEENKNAYINAMCTVSATGDWEAWSVFFLDAVEKQAARNLLIAEDIRALYEEMKEVFSRVLSSKWSVNALDFVFAHPVFRNNKFTASSGIPTPTAVRFTKELLQNGLIQTVEEASGRRAALYSFEPLMRLVRV